MATRKSQRIGILIIAIVLAVGTIGSFIVMILANDNATKEQAKLQEQYQKLLDEQTKRTDELSAKYYSEFKPYESVPAAFEAGSVGDTVTTNDLRQGEGDTIGESTAYEAYYIGWNPKGKVFDSSFDGDKLKAPLDTSGTSLISGWGEGVVGMKVGGVREITIPSDKAYGESGSGDDIPPNTPIKFIIMVISKK